MIRDAFLPLSRAELKLRGLDTAPASPDQDGGSSALLGLRPAFQTVDRVVLPLMIDWPLRPERLHHSRASLTRDIRVPAESICIPACR